MVYRHVDLLAAEGILAVAGEHRVRGDRMRYLLSPILFPMEEPPEDPEDA